MPVSAQLSRQLQDAIGREAADGPLDWMTTMDQQRADLRELNEMNFSRFDARLGERTAELRQEMRTSFTAVDVRFAELRQEMQAGDAALHAEIAELRQEMQTGFARVDGQIAALRTEMQAGDMGLRLEIANLATRMEAGFGRMEAMIERTRTEMMKWVLRFGVGAVVAVTGLVLAIERLAG
jgi:hypothetical protein